MSEAPANPHLGPEPVRVGPDPAAGRRVAVLLHGRDQDDALMRDVAARIALPDVAYVLPLAAGRLWYPGRYFDPLASLEPELGWSLAAIDRALDAVNAAGVTDERIVLGGFSMGACVVAQHLAVAGPRRFAGAAVLTGCLPGSPAERARPRIAPGLPIAFVSSRHDEWIAFPDALETAERFSAAGARTTVVELDDRVHHVADRAVDELRELLS